jgi:hypothetical protein
MLLLMLFHTSIMTEKSFDILKPSSVIFDEAEPNGLAYFVFIINEHSSLFFDIYKNGFDTLRTPPVIFVEAEQNDLAYFVFIINECSCLCCF